jgi:hypothetical protein
MGWFWEKWLQIPSKRMALTEAGEYHKCIQLMGQESTMIIQTSGGSSCYEGCYTSYVKLGLWPNLEKMKQAKVLFQITDDKA